MERRQNLGVLECASGEGASGDERVECGQVRQVGNHPQPSAQVCLSRPVILTTCYVADAERMQLVKFWLGVQTKVNPGVDIFLVDSCSPFPAKDFLPEMDGLTVITLDHGMDAIITAGKYTHIAYVETDMFLVKPVHVVTERLAKYGMKVAMPFDTMYQFLETGLAFYEIQHLIDKSYTKSYDWNNPPEMFHEIWTEWFFGADIHTLLLRGLRNDMDQINRQNILQAFPYGLDYLTHCKDYALYKIMYMMNRIEV